MERGVALRRILLRAKEIAARPALRSATPRSLAEAGNFKARSSPQRMLADWGLTTGPASAR